MKTPIHDFLIEYSESAMSRFHMPGHKGRADGTRLDITEIHGADSLYEASGIIAESEANASELFGSAATFYSVEGSSQCIRSMLALAAAFGCSGYKGAGSGRMADPGARQPENSRPLILAARNVHHSFITAAALLDLDVEWLYPECDRFSLCGCNVSADQVRARIADMPVRPKAVYITSPDYLGGMADVAGIAEAAHEAGIPLLVDNAHGAYLRFLKDPVHPMDLGADMCCDSAHKTLPSLTGCAYLHIGREAADKDFYINNARKAMMLFGSTSPSYLLMESLDKTNKLLADPTQTGFRNRLAECIDKVTECKAELRSLGWVMHEDDHISCRSDFYEPLKITINSSASGISGTELADMLRQCGIECEYADPEFVVLMPSPYNDQEDFNKLISAMKKCRRFEHSGRECGEFHTQPHTGVKDKMFSIPAGEKCMSIREAVFAPCEIIPVSESTGRILAGTELSCPPAVPVLINGERIPEGAADIFAHYGIKEISVVAE